jgi:hypothetical protein
VTSNSRLLWPMRGPATADPAVTDHRDNLLRPGDLGVWFGAGEGNRTLMTSLEGWGSAIELRPRVPVGGVPGTG